MRPWLIAIMLIPSVQFAVFCQDTPPSTSSTAQKGQLLPGPFRVYAVNGPRAQHFHCFVVENDLNPVIAVFALQPPTMAQEPLAVLLQKTNAFVEANKAHGVGAFAVFLTLEKDFYEDKARVKKIGALEGLIEQYKLSNVSVGLTHPDAKPVKQYGVQVKDDLLATPAQKKHLVTVLIYNRQRVQERFVFTEDKKLDESAIKEIFAAAEKMMPAK